MSEHLESLTPVHRPWLDAREPRWSEAEKAKLKAAWRNPEIMRADLERHVGRTVEACDRMAVIMGLGRRPRETRKPCAHQWTPAQLAVLFENWPDVAKISAMTGRTIYAAEGQGRKFRLPPPKTGRGKGPAPDIVRSAKAEAVLVIRHEAPPTIRRKCLCCGAGFEAAGKFLRMCHPCRKSA